MNQKKAIAQINKKGILLVFPMNNRKEPLSLWSEFYPKIKMRWEWNDSGDNRVGNLWTLMKELSTTKDVIYSKWFQGRATFFSKELFKSLLCVCHKPDMNSKLSRSAKDLLQALESDSPLSTKQLKKITELQGKDNESTYTRSMKQLFTQLLIVGFGEVDDGAFPSLAVGATQLIFEDLWNESLKMSLAEAYKIIDHYMPKESAVRKYFDKILLTK